ncbi:putative cellular retinaldehyde binding/alpha-tocopherol transport, GOLD domain, CRAL/TRIO [Medicago truncatula]|uniref:Putative cellular retinaldehyde binding/alpha-tocopherol transport, GOLD domain, CRAL/TRIO n=1 Tax=Medicago truncatula TaxID=3880 RepID=A0A072V4Y7_MEDTR|nr:patellin-4 [Medicago truncatula]KEH37089.1 Sec14p-like phosphatidylinositol transfer family protein [Medicago truncatula]RHN72944.1 putative cellular retinaldehyde binding/alpha-tocopherol transport, GOLD domain, CRAL/TRIO [Medicago truncatula]
MTAETMVQEEAQKVEVVVEEGKVVEENVEAKESMEESKPTKTVEKCSSYKEESNFLSDLKEFEKKALIEFRSKVEEAVLGNTLFEKKEEETKKVETLPEGGEESSEKVVKEEEEKRVEEVEEKDLSLWGVSLLPSKGNEGVDVVLLKFLRAREFKVNEAFEMLKKTLKWRKEMKIDSVLEEDFGSDLASAAYMNGVDREGHPVCYNIYSVFDGEEIYQKTFGTEEKRKEFLRWRCSVMEKWIQKLNLKPGGVSSLLQINDLKNSPGPSKKELRIATKQTVTMLQDNYPELVAKNIFINVPFWYYALNALLSPFLTQRTKSKFVVARPAKVTETLIKYIPIEEIPVNYGGFKRENDSEFFGQDASVSELFLKAGSTATIEIPALEVGNTLCWDLAVLGWEVSYKEEFVPNDDGSYTVIVQKGKKIGSQEGPIRNTFKNNEPGKVILTINNSSNKKKRVLYRYKTNKSLP